MTTLVRRSEVAVGSRRLGGALELPDNPSGLVLFAHGSGSSRYSPRNAFVAEALLARGFATLLMDLLTRNEARDRRNVFDIPLLAGRVVEAIDWIIAEPALAELPIGLFGASTGAAAALAAAAQRPERVGAVVSRGGRPDLAGEDLARVTAPTLLIVGALDYEVLELNRQSQGLLHDSRLDVVPGATHLFEEPGTLERVVALAADWFAEKLPRRGEDS
ncbi:MULTISPECIES: dienelactone hydrolase family protein [Methylosinus]|uniref:Alpha/beta hydrolase n=1 Tax=Methylosinus trichosporium (strain ATCC 35070 / NCIMB 11131 / UNIQEM 75 / OB3b) TaxID=595536 RepID=A0A2D2D0K4_METT3|nr:MULTISPECIES: alpha/beta fold hydrolase [Methylosinus]ATQ68526.1 alpha/beta hydrolase [Methylosinus trichosporium OB3b]OBS53941.1 hydrolase [Methylosinus sp. 3S-1]